MQMYYQEQCLPPGKNIVIGINLFQLLKFLNMCAFGVILGRFWADLRDCNMILGYGLTCHTHAPFNDIRYNKSECK